MLRKTTSSRPHTKAQRALPRLARAVLAMGVVGGVTVSGALASSASSTTAPKKVTLTLIEAENNPPFTNQIAEFEKAYPNVTISVDAVPFGDLLTKEETLVASGNPPDLLAINQPDMFYFAASGALLPLNQYLPKGYVASLTAGARQDVTYKGQVYSPGPMDTALALFYNKTLLAKAHISPPTSVADGWTWPQAVAAMKACQKANPGVDGQAPSYFGNGTPGSAYYSALFLESEGSPTAPKGSAAYNTYIGISPNGKTMAGYINTPQAIAGATFFQSMFTQKVTPTVGDPTAFVDGKACFEMNTSNAIPAYISGHSGLGSGVVPTHLPFQVGVTPWPYFTTKLVHNGTIAITVSAKTKHVAQAIQFVNFISTRAAQIEEVRNQGYLPVISSLYKTIPGLQQYPWKIFVDELAQFGRARVVTPYYPQFTTLFYNAMRSIAYGANVKSTLDGVATQMDHILQTPIGHA